MNDIIKFNLNVDTPEYTESIEIHFSRYLFKADFKLNKLKRDMVKSQLRLISRMYNDAPIKYGIPNVPVGLYAIHRALIQQEAKVKLESRILYLTYAFIRGIPRKVVENRRASYFADIVNGIRDMIPYHNIDKTGLLMRIRSWYIGDEE